MNRIIWRIAYRNLREHATKTLIIGSLIALGLMVYVIGNSFMDTVNDGIRENYVENYTGHVFVAPASTESPSLVMSPELTENAGQAVPSYPEIDQYLQSRSDVAATTGQVNGFATVQYGEVSEGFTLLYGVSPESYQEMFPEGVNVLEGRFLAQGEKGIVLSRTVADRLAKSAGEAVRPGDTLLLTSMNDTTGMTVRETVVRGIHDYGDASFDLALISFVDAETLRIMNGMTGSRASSADARDAADDSFSGTSTQGFDEAALFADDGLISPDASSPGEAGSASEDEYLGILGDLSERDQLNQTDPNAWSFVLVRLEDAGAEGRVVRELNRHFKEEGIAARAYSWVDGAGVSATLADTLQTVFNVLLVVVAVVGVIIIMNTLVISVTERFSEIGTMRAIGAQKRFVRSMIVHETLMIAGVFGVIGVAAGAIILEIIGAFGLRASNQFLTILLGSGVFSPSVSSGAVLSSIGVAALVGVVAALYPTSLALRISPLAAMNRN